MNANDKSKPHLTFAVYQNDHLVRRETVAQDIVKIGKDPRSHIRVDCEEASRMHAVLEVGSISQLTLIDLGNEPGTLVNGQRINKCQLRLGDSIQIGATRLELERAESSVPVPVSTRPSSAPPLPVRPASTRPAPMVASALPAPIVPVFAGFTPEPYALTLANPFLTPTAPSHQPAYAQDQLQMLEGDEGYAMIKSAPAVHPDEVEVAHLSAVEVLVKWDTNVLHVAHLSPPRSFYVGERAGKGEDCDYLLPTEVLGADRTAIVVERAGSSFLVIPRGASGSIQLPGEGSQAIEQLVASGRARPSSEASGACEIELTAGTRAKMRLANSQLTFEVNAVNAGKRVAMGFLATLEANAYKYVGLSFLAHAGIVASLAFFMPHMNLDDSETIDRDQLALMRHYLDAKAPKELDEVVTPPGANDAPGGGEGERAKMEEGTAGSTVSKDSGKRYAIEKRDDSDPHLARANALREAETFGMVSMLMSGAPNQPTAAWAQDTSNGHDTLSAMGNMWGAEIGDSAGMGGLGLTGTGLGGGGSGLGMGLGDRGLGHGAGCLPGQVCGQNFGPGGPGWGHGTGGKGPRGHETKGPRMIPATITVGGRLPPEVIQRIVRQNYGRFKVCYESALRTNPTLTGRVQVNFAIGRDGAVATASDGGSDIPDQGVISCVTRGFMNLSFPQPEGGIVTVKYPLVFTPE